MPLASSAEDHLFHFLENVSVGGAVVIVAGFALLGFIVWCMFKYG